MNPYAEDGPSPDAVQSPYWVPSLYVEAPPSAPGPELPSEHGALGLGAGDPEAVVCVPSAERRAVANPYPSSPPSPPSPPSPGAVAARSQQASAAVSSPELHPSPPPPPPAAAASAEDTSPDLECSICFSQFNNVFRCPKMLQCKHTFCLECLARMNVKSAEPGAIQCPLCRSLTPLPTLGLPKLATDSDVLSCLPAAMQRVYSIRFLRSKGKLQVKRSSEGQQQRWGQRSLTPANRTLDVGLPSSSPGAGEEAGGGLGGALFRLTSRPACRAMLLTSLVVMMVLLTGIIIFLILLPRDQE